LRQTTIEIYTQTQENRKNENVSEVDTEIKH